MNSVKFEIELPEEFLKYVDSKDLNYHKKVKELMLYQLIKEDKISFGKAAQMLDMTKIDFITDLGKMGIPYFDASIDEVMEDVKVINKYLEEQ